jgi:hypothetical protein
VNEMPAGHAIATLAPPLSPLAKIALKPNSARVDPLVTEVPVRVA